MLDSLSARMAVLHRTRWETTRDGRLEMARTQRSYAYTAGRLGLTEKAQEYARSAQELFLAEGETGWASLCLYERAIAYHSIGDTLHMAALLAELADLAATDTSALTQYNYYAIAFAYGEMTSTPADTIAEWGRRAIYYAERIDRPRSYNIMLVWLYYNQGLIYDLLYTPPRTDSIARYMALARASVATEPHLLDRQEAMISIGDEEAWLAYYAGDDARAEQRMLRVLNLIDSVAEDSPASVITERGEAYSFLVELYSKQGRWNEALNYQQLLTDNNSQRYSTERQRVLDEVQTRYEVEKKEMLIRHQRSIIRLTALTALFLFLAAIALTAALWLRKRRAEDALYVKALEAEDAQNELRQMQAEGSVEPLEALRRTLLEQMGEGERRTKNGESPKSRVERLNLQHFRQVIGDANGLSMMDKRYLMCFAAGLSAEEVAQLFLVEPASVYTVRYRIRKKFPKDRPFPW